MEDYFILGQMAHIGIALKNIKNAIGFYREALALRVVDDVTSEGPEELYQHECPTPSSGPSISNTKENLKAHL